MAKATKTKRSSKKTTKAVRRPRKGKIEPAPVAAAPVSRSPRFPETYERKLKFPLEMDNGVREFLRLRGKVTMADAYRDIVMAGLKAEGIAINVPPAPSVE